MSMCPACDCLIFSPWRDGYYDENDNPTNLNGNGLHYKLSGGAVTEIATWGDIAANVGLILNTELDPRVQSPATDVFLGTKFVACFSGEVYFGVPGAGLFVRTVGYYLPDVEDSFANIAEVEFYGEPGIEVPSSEPGRFYGVVMSTENVSPVLIGASGDDRNQSHGGLYRNNGAFLGDPAPLHTWYSFNVCIDLSLQNPRITTSGDFGDGYMEKLLYLNQDSPLPGEPSYPTTECDHSHHRIQLVMFRGDEVSTEENPDVKIRNMSLGYATCEPNPDYVPPVDTP